MLKVERKGRTDRVVKFVLSLVCSASTNGMNKLTIKREFKEEKLSSKEVVPYYMRLLFLATSHRVSNDIPLAE